jgi:adenylate cyclase
MEANITLEAEKQKIQFEEASKRLELQKEIALEALRFEFEKKQALAASEEERNRLLFEEELKRKDIEAQYAQEQKTLALQYEKEASIKKLKQEKKDALAQSQLKQSENVRNMSVAGAGLSLLLVVVAVWFYCQKRRDNKKIAQEKEKSDALLLNILPHEVAEELKHNGKTEAKHYEEVTVLFTDFAGFTAKAQSLGVQEVLDELNTCFTAFDNIIERYGLEKIKTIGDAYLAVSGLPQSNAQHAKNAVNATREILRFIEERKRLSKNALDIRIGIHSGPVIAGIVGVKKFAFDIWGDTVNTAARMEQNSKKGSINVSHTTYTLTKDDFEYDYRGTIATKGKGELDMYFLI